IRGEAPALYLVYPEGNCIASSPETPYLQLGESKYGKPILDRIIRSEVSLEDAARCALVSLDSTMKSNLSVGPPIDLRSSTATSTRSGTSSGLIWTRPTLPSCGRHGADTSRRRSGVSRSSTGSRCRDRRAHLEERDAHGLVQGVESLLDLVHQLLQPRFDEPLDVGALHEREGAFERLLDLGV